MKMNLTTQYMGITLKNPLVVSSSGLTSSLEKVRACVAAGAGAVVLKSIFQEQLIQKAGSLDGYSDYPEAADYLREYVQSNAMSEYLDMIKSATAEFSTPIIASINCSTAGEWASYAKLIEEAGAAALELNIFILPSDPTVTSEKVEQKYLAIVDSVRAATSLPISVKLPQGFTNPMNIIQQLYFRGVKGVVLFNRFYSPDIDIEQMQVVSSGVFSSQSDISAPLRYTALASAAIPLIDLAVSSGVHTGSDAIKALLVGARVVELCTTLYHNGVDYLQVIQAEIERWAESRNYTSLNDFVGRLNASGRADAEIFERAQFMKYFSAR